MKIKGYLYKNTYGEFDHCLVQYSRVFTDDAGLSRFRMRRKHGDGDRPTDCANSALLIRAFRCSTSKIFKSIASISII